MSEIENLKKKIQQSDAAILEALLTRNQLTEDLTRYKKEQNLPLFQREEEMRLQNWLRKEMDGKPYKKEVEEVFFSIYKGGRKASESEHFPHRFYGGRKIYRGGFFEPGAGNGSDRNGSDHCGERGHEHF